MSASVVEFSPGATRGGVGIKSKIAAYVIEGLLEIVNAGQSEKLQQGDCAVLNTSGLVMLGAGENAGGRALIVNVTS